MRPRPLRILLTVIGLTAVLTGLFGVLTGSAGVVDGSEAAPSVESELRFLYVFWIAYGAAALALSSRVEREPGLVRALAAVMFVGGFARGIAWIDTGRPHGLFIALMALELLIPAAILALQGGELRLPPPRGSTSPTPPGR